MTDLRKAAEMALEALDLINQDIQKHRATLPIGRQPELCKASLALRQALAQPANSTTDLVEPKASSQPEQKREWVGLDEDRVDYLADKYAPPIDSAFQNDDDYWKFYQEIEAELKEKNG